MVSVIPSVVEARVALHFRTRALKKYALTYTTAIIATFFVAQSCSNSVQSHRRKQIDIDQAYALYHERNGVAPIGNDSSLRHHVKSDYLHAIETNRLSYGEANEQVKLWFAPCATWNSFPVTGDINTTGDEYGPVFTNDSTMFFTRSRHASTMCGTSDVFVAHLRDAGWIARNVGRPINDCHETSTLSYNSKDSSVLLYGQYYLANSKILGQRTLSPSYPSDAVQTNTIPYIFDPITDYQPFDAPPILTPLIRDHTSAMHSRYSAGTWASSIVDNQGDIYIARLNKGQALEFPRRMNWPISGGDFDTDAVVTPDGSALFFVSDRPNVMYDYEGKPPLRDRSRLHNWGNTNIYVFPLLDNNEGLHYILGSGVNTPFAERTPSFSADGDTMYFSSNGLPGYGGMDVYYSIRLRKDSWLEWSTPKNLGRGFNTIDDEVWFTRDPSGTSFFARRVNEKLDIYQAVRVPIIRYLRIRPDCKVVENITMHSLHYDGSVSTEEVDTNTLIHNHLIEIDTTDYEVYEFIIKSSTFEPQRHFRRCDAESDTLELLYSDITIYPCDEPSTIGVSKAERKKWTFSRHETFVSVENAIREVAVYISENFREQLIVELAIVPEHGDSLLDTFVHSLKGVTVSVRTRHIEGKASTITVLSGS